MKRISLILLKITKKQFVALHKLQQILNAACNYLARDHESSLELKMPNKETRKAFEETDSGVGLQKSKNILELFKDLDI